MKKVERKMREEKRCVDFDRLSKIEKRDRRDWWAFQKRVKKLPDIEKRLAECGLNFCFGFGYHCGWTDGLQAALEAKEKEAGK